MVGIYGGMRPHRELYGGTGFESWQTHLVSQCSKKCTIMTLLGMSPNLVMALGLEPRIIGVRILASPLGPVAQNGSERSALNRDCGGSNPLGSAPTPRSSIGRAVGRRPTGYRFDSGRGDLPLNLKWSRGLAVNQEIRRFESSRRRHGRGRSSNPGVAPD